MKQELYINNQRADIKDDSLILFTYQQSDYSDPTAVKNSYTKSVTLPGTKNNCKIFNEIYRFDYHQNTQTFNPSKRTQFEIYSNGNLLERGYLKLTKITGQGEYREFQISLYGGLGDFMYNLQYDSDGNKITLYDIVSYDWVDLDFTISRSTVKSAWDRINGDRTGYSKWDYINFAPCYNGLPELDGFDNRKIAVYCGNSLPAKPGVMTDIWIGDIEHNYLITASGDYITWADEYGNRWGLIETGDGMDEWEVGDHRCWMQRPVFSMKFLFKMIENYLKEKVEPRFTMDLDKSWFHDDNPYWNDIWITLPMLYENNEDVKSGDTINHKTLFGSSKTPYEYLISYTKSFSLWYDYDPFTRTLKITPRYSFYSSDLKDISGKIDMSDIKITPLAFSFRTLKYDWKEGEDRISGEYKKKTGEDYGVYGIDTGWEFDNSSKTVPSNQIMKNTVDVRRSGPYFSTYQLVYDDKVDNLDRTYEIMPSWLKQNDIKYTLWNKNNTEDTLVIGDLHPAVYAKITMTLASAYMKKGTQEGDKDMDGAAKPVFSNTDNKSVDGSDVFLLYTGKNTAPRWDKISDYSTYDIAYNVNYITDDIEGFENLTDGKRCWINTVLPVWAAGVCPYATSAEFPKFNRMQIGNRVDWSLDFGKPAQTYVYPDLGYSEINTISRKTFLDEYLADLYSVDTRLVETKMRIEDPYAVMHTMFYFGGCVWVINKMTDFNYENNLTKVEFIKVNDVNSYVLPFPDFDDGDDAENPISLRSGSGTYVMTLDEKCLESINAYKIYNDNSWFTVTSGISSGVPSITIKYQENTGLDERSGYFTLNYLTKFKDVYVRQDGEFTVTPSVIKADNTKQSVNVEFNTVIDTSKYAFYVRPSSDWATAKLGSDNRVTVYIEANDTGQERTCTLTFTYKYITVLTIIQSK